MNGNMFTKTVLLIPLLAVLMNSAPVLGQSEDFRAAVVKRDITPDSPQNLLGYGARLSTGVHDNIYHRILVMDDGNSKFYLVSSDICLVSPSEYDRVAKMLKDRYGIERESFWWSVTHTHSA